MTDAPTFDSIAVTDLPKATKGADPERIALGAALLAVLTPDTAAGDVERFAERKDAVKRAAVLRRAILAAGGAPDGTTIGTQIDATADGFRAIVRMNAKGTGKPK